MINQIVTKIAKREFARALKFEEGILPELPSCTDEKPRLLYMHIPFCEELCPYCSFHRITFTEPLTRKYFKALRREIKIYQEKGYKFKGIYVGGGTPTVLIDELAETFHLAREIFPIQEISVETNPNHLNSKNIEILQQSGVKGFPWECKHLMMIYLKKSVVMKNTVQARLSRKAQKYSRIF